MSLNYLKVPLKGTKNLCLRPSEKSPSFTSSTCSTFFFPQLCAKTHSSGTFVMSYLTYISPRLATRGSSETLTSPFRVFVSEFTRIHLEKLQLEHFSAGWSKHGPISILGGERGGNFSHGSPARSSLAPIGSPALSALGVKELFLCHSRKTFYIFTLKYI